MLNVQQEKLISNCLKIYKGNYNSSIQYASSILLKMLLKEKYNKTMNKVKEELGFRINNRNDSKVIYWKKKIKKAGKCSICGAKNELVAHHIIPWEYSITGKTDILNGQCLCKKCHKMMHNATEWVDYIRGIQHG